MHKLQCIIKSAFLAAGLLIALPLNIQAQNFYSLNIHTPSTRGGTGIRSKITLTSLNPEIPVHKIIYTDKTGRASIILQETYYHLKAESEGHRIYETDITLINHISFELPMWKYDKLQSKLYNETRELMQIMTNMAYSSPQRMHDADLPMPVYLGPTDTANGLNMADSIKSLFNDYLFNEIKNKSRELLSFRETDDANSSTVIRFNKDIEGKYLSPGSSVTYVPREIHPEDGANRIADVFYSKNMSADVAKREFLRTLLAVSGFRTGSEDPNHLMTCWAYGTVDFITADESKVIEDYFSFKPQWELYKYSDSIPGFIPFPLKKFYIDKSDEGSLLELKMPSEPLSFAWTKALDDDLRDTVAYKLTFKVNGDTTIPELSYSITGDTAASIDVMPMLSISKNYMVYLTAFNRIDSVRSDTLNFRTSDKVTSTENTGNDFGYMLLRNFPNPFNGTTTIRYLIPEESNVSITVFDLLGRELRKIKYGILEKGLHEETLNSDWFSSGVYIVKFTMESNIDITKKYGNSLKVIVLK